jgi:hypothetical protein
MINALLLFIVNVAYIWLKAFQQLNVVHHKLAWVAPTSLLMGACEVFAIATIAATQNYWYFIPVGLGGGLGCILAMLTHKYIRDRKGRH